MLAIIINLYKGLGEGDSVPRILLVDFTCYTIILIKSK